jgi:hypothetical protein
LHAIEIVPEDEVKDEENEIFEDSEIAEPEIIKPTKSLSTEFNFIDKQAIREVVVFYFKGNAKAAKEYFQKESYYLRLKGKVEFEKFQETQRELEKENPKGGIRNRHKRRVI